MLRIIVVVATAFVVTVVVFGAGCTTTKVVVATPTIQVTPTLSAEQLAYIHSVATQAARPADTPIPTSTPVPPAPIPPVAPPPPISPAVDPSSMALSGSGQQATDFFSLDAGLTVFRMTHSGSSNFAIWLLDSGGNRIELLVNEIGPFDGAKSVGITRSGSYLLDVSADGRWNVSIEQPRNVQAAPPPPQISGRGQQVTQLLALRKGLARIQMTHDGQSNFAIWLIRDNGARVDLLVNEIGPFNGSAAVQIPANGNYALDIAADGNWTVAIAQ